LDEKTAPTPTEINRRKQKRMEAEKTGPEPPANRLNGRMWQPGQSGNLNGRPVGSRNAFSAAFLQDLRDVWIEHGKQAMELTAKNNPEVFFATCARVLPRDVSLTVDARMPGSLGADDWATMLAVLDAVRQALPGANSKSPAEVLEFVLCAIRMANAPTIDG
jgi:hypothetical protein